MIARLFLLLSLSLGLFLSGPSESFAQTLSQPVSVTVAETGGELIAATRAKVEAIKLELNQIETGLERRQLSEVMLNSSRQRLDDISADLRKITDEFEYRTKHKVVAKRHANHKQNGGRDDQRRHQSLFMHIQPGGNKRPALIQHHRQGNQKGRHQENLERHHEGRDDRGRDQGQRRFARQGHGRPRAADRRDQIGRASCRERV